MSISAESRAEVLETLARLLKKFDVSPDIFLRTDLGTALNFQSIQPVVAEIIGTVKQVREGPYAVLPEHIARLANSALDSVNIPLQALISYEVSRSIEKGENPVEARNRLANALEQAAEPFFKEISFVLAYVAALQLGQKRESLEIAVRDELGMLKRSKADAEATVKELSDILAASRDSAAKIGASQHAAHFAQEATQHAKASRAWLWATVIGGALTFTAGILNYSFVATTSSPSDNAAVVQLIVAKLLLFSMLLSGTLWCGKNYRASQHNLIVNRHRQNALSSFQTFAESASDPQTKNAVLLQATQSIFSPQASGYVANEAEPSGSPQIIELIRSVAGSGK